jgi:Leucine-rich repeat (LRR) protein
MIAFGLPEPKKKTFSAIRLDNNQLSSLDGFGAALARVVKDPKGVRMLDLSFNQLGAKTAASLAALGMDGMLKLYLHGNEIKHLSEVDSLAKAFPALQGLTLHGTPLREHDAYRNYVISTVSGLVKLDFTPVTPAERDTAVSWRAMTKVKKRHD